MTILILAEPHDATAHRVAALARQAYSTPAVRVVSSLEIARAPRWSHEVGADGVATHVRLVDGTTLRSGDIAGVFNRLWPVPASAFTSFDPTDREYAQAEMHALLVSWLASLTCPVINRASPHSLCGSPWSHVKWRIAAGRAGLETLPIRLTTSQRRYPPRNMMRVADLGSAVIATPDLSPLSSTGPGIFVDPVGERTASIVVVGNSVWPESLSPHECDLLRDGCCRLATDAGTEFLRVRFISTPDEQRWMFCGAEAVPDVWEVGPLSALVEMIGGAESPHLVQDEVGAER